MKRISLILGLLLVALLPLAAKHVDPETARKVATTFLNNNGAKTDQLTDLSKEAGFSNLYIFNANPGFVVMAADDCVKPILGYSLTGKFEVEGMPENLRWWLQGYDDQIHDAIEDHQKATAHVSRQWKDLASGTTTSAKTRTEVGPFITTKWDQTYPYNYYCPTCSSGGNGGHVYTGCVATAMAQVINYHQHPTQGIGSHTYVHSTYGTQTANFGETTYDWNNMTTSITSNSSQVNIDAVATLIYHCGVAVDMDYGSGGSGAYSTDIAPALINYFDFSHTTTFKDRSNYSDTDWIHLMRTELDNNRPIIYGGMDHPTAPESGHSFVCDGYGKDGYGDYYFHFNWGWSGYYDDYFSIDLMTPGGNGAGGGNHNYSYLQDAIVGIEPANCQASAPSDLTYTASGRDITLSWNGDATAKSHSIYRNSMLIGTTEPGSTLTYLDKNAPYGTNTYYVRSSDAQGELSTPSNTISVTITFPAPTGLTVTSNDDGILLTWTASSGVNGYHVYCNDILLSEGLVTTTSFTDQRTISGSLKYWVKAVDNLGDESEASDAVSITVSASYPYVTDFRASMSGNDVAFQWTTPAWCFPSSPGYTLAYVNESASIGYVWSCTYYGHKYPSANLTQYANKAVYRIDTKVLYAGTYTVYVYTDTKNSKPDPDALAATNTLVCKEGEAGWRQIVLSTPVMLSGDKDLWVVIKQEGTDKPYPVPSTNLSTYNENACYYGSTSPESISPASSDYSVSWLIRPQLTEGVYSYDLYDGTTKLNGSTPINGTNYTLTGPITNGVHKYTIKTKNSTTSGGYESNKAYIVTGNASITSNINIGENDRMVINSGSTLTVSSSKLTNNYPANLVLEDGAQLFYSSNTKATVKKSINGYGTAENQGGWHLIASPITGQLNIAESTNLSNAGEFDLYIFDQTNSKEWLNYKQNHFTTIDNKKGYLYAHKDGIDIEFAGTVNNTSGYVGLTYSSDHTFSGYNLIGNPYPCNATITREYYRIVETAEGSKLQLASSAIAPMEGILVKSSGTSDNGITFTKESSSKENNDNKAMINLTVAKGKDDVVDNARIRFEGDLFMEKLTLRDGGTKLYFLQDGQEYALIVKDDQNEIPVCFKANTEGEYTLNVSETLTSNLSPLNFNYLHLVDNLTGADIDLLQNPSYSFEARTDDYAARFKLVFNVEDHNDTYGEDFVEGKTTIIDMTGRVVATDRDTQLAPGVYIIRTTNGNETHSKKIIIK